MTTLRSPGVQSETEVVIVGAGPAGLATAIELGRRGIRTVVVEQQREIAEGHPRAAQLQVRTMEFFRRWGIATRLREHGLLAPEFGPTVSFATSMTGLNIATVPFFASTGGPSGTISPEEGGWAPQFHFTRVMEEVARSLASVEVLRGWRYTGLSEGPSSAGDGGQGTVRRDAGIEYQGVPDLSHWLYIPFRAPDLAATMTVDASVMYFVFTPDGTMVVRPISRERWDIQLAGFDPSTDVASLDVDAIARAAIGPTEVGFTAGRPAVSALPSLIPDRDSTR